MLKFLKRWKIMNKNKKKNKIFRWVDSYADYRYAFIISKWVFLKKKMPNWILKIYKKWNHIEKLEEKPFNLNKIKNIILKFILNKKYWYIKIMLMLLILYLIYEDIFFWRYIISLILFIFLMIYKFIYYYLSLNETQIKIKILFEKYKIINCVGKVIYMIINYVLWWHFISYVWLEIVKIIRYISIRINVVKYWHYIDIILNYIINIYMKLWLIQIGFIIKKIKEKIIKKKIKEIISWRLTLIIINLLLIQKIIVMLGLNLPWILILFIIYNIYILEKSLLYLSDKWNNNNYYYYIIISSLSNYQSIKDVYEINKLSVIFKNLKLNINKSLIDFKISYFFKEQCDLITTNNQILYPYWYHPDLYYAEVYKNILTIKELNEFFGILKSVIKMNYMDKWLYNILLKTDDYNFIKNRKDIGVIYYNKNEKKIQNEKLSKYQFEYIKSKYNKIFIKKNLDISVKLYKLCEEYLNILNGCYKKTNQELKIEIIVYLRFMRYIAYSDYSELPDDIGFNEIIYFNYKLINKDYKISDNTEDKKKLKEIKKKIDNLYDELNLLIKEVLINIDWNITEINYVCGREIHIIDIEKNTESWYTEEEFQDGLGYKSVNIDWIVFELKNLIKDKEKIKLIEEIQVNKA